MRLLALRVLGFALALAVWLADLRVEHGSSVVTATLCALAIVPVVWVSARALERRPTIERCSWLTSIVHTAVMVLFGVAIIESVTTYLRSPVWPLPVPRPIGAALLGLTAVAAALSVVNLAVSGLGAPFAIALSRRLARQWMYARTRNPMVLCTMACLCSAAIYLQSLQFLLWVLFVLTPPWLYFLKAYEERELEIRFGAPYLEYKATTPFLWPGRAPRRRAGG